MSKVSSWMTRALWGLVLWSGLPGTMQAQEAIEVIRPQVSVQGRAIPIYRFGEGHQEYLFLFAGFHGNEPQGTYMLEQLMERFKHNSAYYAEKSIFIMPRVNPDALFHKRRTNANGVDLNRNFPTRNFVPGAYKGRPYYAGASALSEPESQIVHELLTPFTTPERREKVKILTLHAPYAVNNYDGPARELAVQMARHNGYPARADIGYPTPGSFGTYYGKEREIRVITLETANEAPSAAWQRHEKALLSFLQFPQQVLYPQPLPQPTPSVAPSEPPPSEPAPAEVPGENTITPLPAPDELL